MPACDRRTRNRLAASLLSTLGALASHAAEDAPAGGKLSVKGSVTAGVAYRTVSQDTDLVADVNGSQVGIRGTALTPTTGRNQDDGNLNFDKGDPVSQIVNGYVSIEYAAGDFGAKLSAKA